MFNENKNEPCLVKLERGFSVNYKNRFLYSKYNPEKNILSIIENLKILSGTIIFCFSPVLKYGIEELCKKLPENCIAFGIEKDEQLYKIAKSQTENLECSKSGIFTLIPYSLINFIPEKIEQLCQSGNFKRIISIEFSGGFAFYADFYKQILETSQNVVNQFWKNRITLVKFGKNYFSNLFKNLKYIPQSLDFIKTEKPIIVVGAGESAIKTLQNIKESRNNYFIIAVDAILKSLKALNIKPNAVVCEESQSIIVKAFSGSKNWFDFLFVSTTATNTVTRLAPQKNIFYTPLFAKTEFLSNLQKNEIIKNVQNPLGSVGLSATEIALKVRKSENVPIFVTGLDFSYSIGRTHAKSSFHESARLEKLNKLNSKNFYSSAFGNDCTKVIGKNGKIVITTTALSNYAKLFCYVFCKEKNLFDSGESGINLAIPQKSPFFNSSFCNLESNVKQQKSKIKIEQIQKFIESEKSALILLKSIFTGKIELSEKERNEKIASLLKGREYLYLNFPDGYKVNLSQNFLNRVRVQIDYFLKVLS